MSRNFREKPLTSVGKKSVKRSRNSFVSDDDDYSGVDLISDSEGDEPDVEVAEEQAIIESEEEDDDYASPQLQADDDKSSWGGLDMFDDNPDLFFGEQIVRPAIPDIFTVPTGWMTEAGSDDESQPETARRVRFDLSDTDTAVSEIEDNIFPDIFLEQGSLDPGFRRTIENDQNKDNDDPPSDDGSYWDFRGDDVEIVEEDHDCDEDKQSESSCGSSGYETDEGETTEEDLPAAAKFLPARSLLRRQSNDSSSSEEDIQVIRRTPYRPQRDGPRLGSWVTDASKPFAVLDSRGKKLMMFRARINRRHSLSTASGRPVPRAYIDEDDREASGMEQMSPMISNSANLMMSAMYTPMDNLGGNALGPPEAFYPFVSIASNGNITQDCPSSSFDEDDVDDDDLWNIGDLIDFGDDTSDEEVNNDDDEDSCDSATGCVPSTPARPSTANSEDQSQSLFNHLNSGIVGAFRRNQNRHQLLSRNTASRESLAFSGRYGQGAIRGIKGGRLAAANTPITPLRKTKAIKADPVISPSPADGEKKRKFSGDGYGHKRIRSLF